MPKLRRLRPRINTLPNVIGSVADGRPRGDGRSGAARSLLFTSRWQKARRAFKVANPLCLGCTAVGLVKATQAVDHIEPHRGDERLFWDPHNWQPACQWHHNAIKAQLEAWYDRGEITADQLRLDSEKARELTRSELNRGGGRKL